jgi:choline-sulfatase
MNVNGLTPGRRRTAGLPSSALVGFLLALVLTAAAARAEAAADPSRPVNVLFLMTDQHRADALGCAGNPVVKTPNLDALAAGGTRFANAFTVVPYCSPTRAALVTGRYPSSLGLGRNIDAQGDPLRLREPCETYLHRLAALGYRCHQLGKWHLGDPAELTCFPEANRDEEALRRRMAERNHAAGTNRFDAAQRPGETERIGDVWLRTPIAEAHRRLLQEKARPKQDIGLIGRSTVKPEFSYESVLADYCIELLTRHRDEPFAITYSVSPPHALNVVPSPFYDRYDPATLPLPTTWTNPPAVWATTFASRMGSVCGEAGLREYTRCYYGQVTMMDGCFGRILRALDELGLTDRTLVVFTSDHGNLLGQHGLMDKAVPAFYDDLMRVPLILRLPGRIPAGRTNHAWATSVDVAPTILDYLGAAPLAKAHGRSLRPLLEGKPDEEGSVFGERGPLDKPEVGRMIRTRQWKLNVLPGGRKELFDLENDPNETRNVADDPARAALIRTLTGQLRDHMRSVGDPAAIGSK